MISSTIGRGENELFATLMIKRPNSNLQTEICTLPTSPTHVDLLLNQQSDFLAAPNLGKYIREKDDLYGPFRQVRVSALNELHGSNEAGEREPRVHKTQPGCGRAPISSMIMIGYKARMVVLIFEKITSMSFIVVLLKLIFHARPRWPTFLQPLFRPIHSAES